MKGHKMITLLSAAVLLPFLLTSCIPFLFSPEVYVDLSNPACTGRIIEISVRISSMEPEVDQVYIKRLSGEGEYYVVNSSADVSENGIATFYVIEKSAGTKEYEIYGTGFSKKFTISVRKSPWMVGVYMAADNSLNDYAEYDVEEMEKLSEYVGLYILWDAAPSTGYEVLFTSDASTVYFPLNTEIDTGDSETLKQFLNVLFSFEADRYAVVLWDHGSAWLCDSSYEEGKGKGLKAIAVDETSRDALSIRELSEALKGALNESGVSRLDVLGMDACVMGNIAVAYQFRDIVDYLIVSEVVEPGGGWDYTFLSGVTSDTDPFQFSKMIVDSYGKFYESFDSSITLAVYDEENVRVLATNISDLGEKLREAISNDSTVKDSIINNILPNVVNMYHKEFEKGENLVDIQDFSDLVKEEDFSDEINQAVQKVVDSLKAAIPYSYIRGAGLSGISIFLPVSKDYLDYFKDDLETLEFYTDSTIDGWYNFLLELWK